MQACIVFILSPESASLVGVAGAGRGGAGGGGTAAAATAGTGMRTAGGVEGVGFGGTPRGPLRSSSSSLSVVLPCGAAHARACMHTHARARAVCGVTLP